MTIRSFKLKQITAALLNGLSYNALYAAMPIMPEDQWRYFGFDPVTLETVHHD